MMDSRKRAVSLRLGSADLRRIKRAAERLGLRDSDLIRYAIKSLLARISPLTDPQMNGRALVPMFLESATDLVHHFDLDVARLDAIVNAGVTGANAVPAEDLHLIAMTAAQATVGKPGMLPSTLLQAVRPSVMPAGQQPPAAAPAPAAGQGREQARGRPPR